MANKSAKTLATRNTSRLRQTHLISLTIHILFLLLQFTLRPSLSLTRYIFLTLPSILIEIFLDRSSRPTYNPDGSLRKAGDDLDAKGLTEFMWDVIYWTWINLILVGVLGNWAWWGYLVVPGYAVFVVVTTVGGVRGMLGGLSGAGAGGNGEALGVGEGGGSNRQRKMEKRGGQRVAYR